MSEYIMLKKKQKEEPLPVCFEEVLQVTCPILNKGNEGYPLDVILKFVDFEPYQIICPVYLDKSTNRNLEDVDREYYCDLKRDEEDSSCLYCKWKIL